MTTKPRHPLDKRPRPRVAIADKNPVIRVGLKDFIIRDGRFELVGIVARGGEFLKLIEAHPIDVGVVGWSLPDMTGGKILSELKQRQKTARVIIYTGENGADILRQSVKLGARGFVSKSEEPADLLDAIAAVARGRLSLPYQALHSLSHGPLDDVTARERELLTALTEGWSNFQIAARFGISHNTVKYHLKNLYEKLGASNRAMAVAMFMAERNDHN